MKLYKVVRMQRNAHETLEAHLDDDGRIYHTGGSEDAPYTRWVVTDNIQNAIALTEDKDHDPIVLIELISSFVVMDKVASV